MTGTGLPPNIGPYRPIRLLGEGGMGSVYEAVHQTTERRVAVKILLPEYARDPTMTARFFNERAPQSAPRPCPHPGSKEGSGKRFLTRPAF